MRALSVFIHSTGTGPSMWASVPEAVYAGGRKLTPTNLGYPPLPPLQRGERCDIARETAHLEATIGAGDEGVHLYAHSYGGACAILLARRLGARVRSLFLFEPIVFGALSRDATADPEALREARGFEAAPWFLDDDERGGSDEWLEIFIDYWNRAGSWGRLPPAARDQLRAVSWKMYQEVRSCFHDLQSYDDAPIPNVPCTLVTAERSPKAARAMVKALAERTPHAHVTVLPGASHMAPVTHPAIVHEAMLEHVARVGS